MPRFRIRHDSLYAYDRPVRFGCWRLLMRPLDTHATRLIEGRLETPPADVLWSYDAYGNCVCHFQPSGPSDRLRVVNTLVVDRFPSLLTTLPFADTPASGPIVYSPDDRVILNPFIAPADEDDGRAYREWLRSVAPAADEPPLLFLDRLNGAIHDTFAYGVRNEPGTQSPDETIAKASGTCRDFAWLMIESVRRFGFAARFATGYLHSPGGTAVGAGATHAWCEVFLPALGWTEFDPTNALVESPSLIRVAATRTWKEAEPMNGTVLDQAACDLTVSVDVEQIDETAVEAAQAA